MFSKCEAKYINTLKIKLNRKVHNELRLECVPRDQMKDLEFQVQKFRALGRDYFNMCERKVVQDEADLRNQFFAKSNPYFEIRFDEVEYGSKQKGHCDVLKFKILSRDWYLTKIKTIVFKFFASRYKELKVKLTGGKNFKRKDYEAICDFAQNE